MVWRGCSAALPPAFVQRYPAHRVGGPPWQQKQRVCATLSQKRKTQEKSADTRCRCCRSGVCLLPLLSVCWRCRGPPSGPVLSPLVAVRRPRRPWLLWSWCPVPGCSRVGGGFSCFFRRCREAGGSFCAGPRRPSGPCAAGCPLALAVARRSTTTCCFASTQEQEPPPSNTGNKLPQPPPQRKAPWKP